MNKKPSLAERWLLPDGMDELLPSEARHIETLRRKILDIYYCWGYDLVIPPHIEHLESLLPDGWHELNDKTFKLIDPQSGRLLGLRADTTPAVARIDAHRLKQEGPTRLCYAGNIFHTHASSLNSPRSLLQIGAELYGHKGMQSDIEIISLLLETLSVSGLGRVQLDFGHAGIYRGLVEVAKLDEVAECALREKLLRKATHDIENWLDDNNITGSLRQMFLAIGRCQGKVAEIKNIKKHFVNAPDSVRCGLEELEQIGQKMSSIYPEHDFTFDLGELHGYNYHTGVIFSAYAQSCGYALAKGGRYDGIGRLFGRERPATGFSTFLNHLLGLVKQERIPQAIFAPHNVDHDVVSRLRKRGERVVCALFASATAAAQLNCDRILRHRHGRWQVEPL